VPRMTELHSIAPLLIVRELETSLRFYLEKLGFSLRFQLPAEDPFFAIIGRDEVQLHLKEIGAEAKPQPNPQVHSWAPWDAFVFVPDPEGLVADFARRGLEPAPEELERDDGLYGFEVEDPDGYVLFFGRPGGPR
jgi:catechol 2,3-dioxygenase-like lactoylglutathione lyase family enzyme